MARRLEGQTFILGYNNGVTALTHRTVRDDGRKLRAIAMVLEKLSTTKLKFDEIESAIPLSVGPVFTFASEERAAKEPWFTGDGELLRALEGHILAEGGKISSEGLFVPFSNGLEIGLHGPEAQKEELRFVTSGRQFEEAFGISIPALLTRSRLEGTWAEFKTAR